MRRSAESGIACHDPWPRLAILALAALGSVTGCLSPTTGSPPDGGGAGTDSGIPWPLADGGSGDLASPLPDAGTGQRCSTRDEVTCLTTPGCVLEFDIEPGRYRCRDAADACERQVDKQTCHDQAGCRWDPGICYCPPGSTCKCSGGLPSGCHAADADPVCRPELPYCAEGLVCCAQGRDPFGACVPDYRCGDDGLLDCATRLQLRNLGGLCEYGACYQTLRIQGADYVYFDEESPESPRETWLTPRQHKDLDELLAQIAKQPFEEGYGACCNAWSDGSDEYLDLYRGGAVERTIRISEREQAPEVLRKLLGQLDQIRNELWWERTGRPVACPGPDELPVRTDLQDPAPSCAATQVLAAQGPYWSLAGPDGQHVSRERVQLPGVEGVNQGAPVTFRLNGEVTGYTQGQAYELTSEQGARWVLNFPLPPGPLPYPMPCLVLGQRIRLTAHLTWAFDWNSGGLLVRDDADEVLFLLDEGLAGLHELPEAPFTVAVTDAGCPAQPGDQEIRQAQRLTFLTDETRLDLLTGEWGRFPLPHGRELAVINLRSYTSNWVDNGWNYAYLGLALAGRNRPSCARP